MRPHGDECYVCPSCKGGTYVLDPGNHIGWQGFGNMYVTEMDVCECETCGCLFAVCEASIKETA